MIARYSVILGLVLALTGCFSGKYDRLPPELGLRKPIYDVSVSHLFGPGGINHGFHVFTLSDRVLENAKAGGLTFFTGFASVAEAGTLTDVPAADEPSGPWEVPFSEWQTLPVAIDDRWPRRGGIGETAELDVAAFFNAADFEIDEDYVLAFHQAIQSDAGFYAYGGYRNVELIVVSLDQGRAYYLFRD